MSKFKIYFHGIIISIISRFLLYGSGFIIIWLLNRILTKEVYGQYALSMTIIKTAALIASFGLQRAVLYRLSRLDLEAGILGGKKYVSAAFWWSMLSSCLFTLIFIFIASWIASLFRKPDLTFWLIALSFMIPLYTGNEIYSHWYKSRQRIVESVLISEIIFNTLILIFITLVWMLLPSVLGVILAYILSGTITLIIWIFKNPLKPVLFGQINKWDMQYGNKLVLSTILKQGIQRLNILVLAFFVTSSVVADYAVASTAAILILIGNQIINPIFSPRIGNLLSKNRIDLLIIEYDQARTFSLLSGLVIAVIFVAFGKSFLDILGDYRMSYSILLILTAGYIIQIAFGPNGNLLNLGGYGNWTLFISCFALLSNIMFSVLLIPQLGAEGAALATLIAFALVNITMYFIIYKIMNISILKLNHVLTVPLISIILIMTGFGSIDITICTVLLMIFLIYYSLQNYKLLLKTIQSAKTTIKS